MRKLRTLDEFAEQYFCDQPEEIDLGLQNLLRSPLVQLN